MTANQSNLTPEQRLDAMVQAYMTANFCGSASATESVALDLLKRLDAAEAPCVWQPIETAPKNRKILATYLNPLGKRRTVLACFYTRGTLPLSDDAELPEDGSEWAPEDWYEEQETHDELRPITEALTHWRPLPDPPVQVKQKEDSRE